MTRKCLMVGAGLSGAVIGRALAEAEHRVIIAESRTHIAGNCHGARNAHTGVMAHVCVPHISHASDAEVCDDVSRFARFIPYRSRVKTTSREQAYALPINLPTINRFSETALSPDEALALIARKADISVEKPISRNRRCAPSALGSTKPFSGTIARW